MGENYNTGTCTIRVGRDYVCLNFGSNLAASASVRDRGTNERGRSGRVCSVTVPITNCMVNRLPRSFAAKVGSTNVRRDLRDVWGAVETEGAPRPHRVQAGVAAATGLKIALWRLIFHK